VAVVFWKTVVVGGSLAFICYWLWLVFTGQLMALS
jgi:hypothetical protein